MNTKIFVILFCMLMCTSTVVSVNVIKNENKNEKVCINPGAPQKTVMGGKLTPPWGWWGHYHERTIDEGGGLWSDDGTEEGDEYEVDIYAHQTNGAAYIWPFPANLEVTQRASNVEKWTIPETGPYSFKFDLDCSGDYYLFSQYEELEIFIYYSLAFTETYVYFRVEDIDQNDLWAYEKKVCDDMAANGQKFGDDYSAHESKRSDTLNLNKGEQIWISGGIKVVTYTTGTLPGIVEGNHNSKLNYVEIDWPNDPPNKPTISGPTSGSAGSYYDYKFISTDPEGDDISYNIKWGDDETTGWTSFYSSGTQITKGHSWDYEDTFYIRAKAKDEYGAESGWESYTISMPRSKEINKGFSNLLEKYPLFYQFLQGFCLL
jgi:hypothetical protein